MKDARGRDAKRIGQRGNSQQRVVSFGGVIEGATKAVLRLPKGEYIGTVPLLVVKPTVQQHGGTLRRQLKRLYADRDQYRAEISSRMGVAVCNAAKRSDRSNGNMAHSFHQLGDTVVAVIIHREQLVDPMVAFLLDKLGVVKITQLRDHVQNVFGR